MSKIKPFYTLSFCFLLFSCRNVKLSNDNFLSPTKKYSYRALYVENFKDTLTRELMLLRPTGKKWFGITKQYAFDYIYTPEIERLKEYENRMMYRKYQEKDFHFKERVGGYCDSTLFYLHPPRANQYALLFYGAHPFVIKSVLEDTSMNKYEYSKTIPTYGQMTDKYTIKRGGELTFNSKRIKTWNIEAISSLTDTTSFMKNQLKDGGGIDTRSTMSGIYSEEFGFIKLHYFFNNGVRIFFDLITVEEK